MRAQKPYLLFLFVSFLAGSSLKAENSLETGGWRLEERNGGPEITASEYCAFLNAGASVDFNGAYNEKMDSLVRSGSPGHYTYAVLSGEEEKAINFVDDNAALQYCTWKESGDDCEFLSPSCSQEDAVLRSNHMEFYTMSASRLVGLNKKKSGDGEKDASWKKFVKEAAVVGGLLVGGEESAEETQVSTGNQIPNARNGLRNMEGVIPKLEERVRDNIKTKITADVALDTLKECNTAKITYANIQGSLESKSVHSPIESNKFLEHEICNNIYQTCLAKVAGLSLQESQWAQAGLTLNQAQEREWAAAEKMAIRNKEKAERVFDKARRETKKAEVIATEAKKRKKAIARNAPNSSEYIESDRAEVAANNDYENKQLAEELAEAQLETACATLMAIEVRNTVQSTAAELALDKAKKAEQEALRAFEEASSRADDAVADLEKRIQKITMENEVVEQAEAEREMKIRNAKAAWNELVVADNAYAVAAKKAHDALAPLKSLAHQRCILKKNFEEQFAAQGSSSWRGMDNLEQIRNSMREADHKFFSAKNNFSNVYTAAGVERAVDHSYTLACNTTLDGNTPWKATAVHWKNCSQYWKETYQAWGNLNPGSLTMDQFLGLGMDRYITAVHHAAQKAIVARDDIMRAIMETLHEE